MQLSDYSENKLVDHVTNVAAFTSPTTVYLALYTVTPTDAGGGTEVTGGAYARQAITFAAAANRSSKNSAQILFPEATANWGTIVAFGIFDAVTAGNLLVWGPLTTSRIINAGTVFKVEVNKLDVFWVAGKVTNFLANKLLDHLLKNTTYTAPATLYAALFTTATTDAGGGTEVTGGSYARKATGAFSAASGGSTDNDAEILFDQATANWGTLLNSAIMDALTVGNMLFHAALDSSVDINEDDQYRFKVGDLDISMD